MKRAWAALELALQFPWQVLLSGFATLRIVLAGARRPPAGFVRMVHAPLGDVGTTVLACMISLTPGTTVLAVDRERRELLLHLLDARDPAATVAAIRAHFERPLTALFGRGAAG